jgi:hypothetical protein
MKEIKINIILVRIKLNFIFFSTDGALLPWMEFFFLCFVEFGGIYFYTKKDSPKYSIIWKILSYSYSFFLIIMHYYS